MSEMAGMQWVWKRGESLQTGKHSWAARVQLSIIRLAGIKTDSMVAVWQCQQFISTSAGNTQHEQSMAIILLVTAISQSAASAVIAAQASEQVSIYGCHAHQPPTCLDTAAGCASRAGC